MKIMWTTSSFSIEDFPENWEVIPNPYRRRLTEDEILQHILEYQPIGIIAGVEPLTEKILKAATNLKVISRCGVGMDSVDLMIAEKQGIKVLNTPQAPVVSVAELALAFIMSLARKLGEIDRSVKNGEWNKAKGYLVSGKTVGIIGCGRIGTHVARVLSAMGCTVLGYDPYLKNHEICRMTDLETIWKEADIISLHVPHTNDTHHLIDKAVLSKLQKDCLLVNTARGGLIDEEALYQTLLREEIAGAALDVFEEEPYNGPLCELKNNILLTAHVASSAREGRALMEQEAMDNLKQALDSLQ